MVCQTYMVCMRVALCENDGNRENDENDEDNPDRYKQGVECWISRNHGNHGNDENHGNPGCKPRVPQTTGLETPEIVNYSTVVLFPAPQYLYHPSLLLAGQQCLQDLKKVELEMSEVVGHFAV